MLGSIARGNSGLLLEKRRGDRNQQGLCSGFWPDQSMFSRLMSLLYTPFIWNRMQKNDLPYAENRGKCRIIGVS